MQVIIDTKKIQDIPILTMVPGGKSIYPVVFFIPGFKSGKETGLSLGYKLAREGFYFVSIDPWLHGERYDMRLHQAADPKYGGVYPEDTGLDAYFLMMKVIGRCLADVRTLIDELDGDPLADLEHCGMTGISMGGYASFLVFANLSRIQAAVPMIGLPSFTRCWLDVLDECRFSNQGWAAALERLEVHSKQQTAYVEQLDPYEKLKEAPPRALLIMNNDFDSDQPKSYSIYAYRKLLPYYKDYPGKLKLNIYLAGHTVTPEMEREAVEWFCCHLKQ